MSLMLLRGKISQHLKFLCSGNTKRFLYNYNSLGFCWRKIILPKSIKKSRNKHKESTEEKLHLFQSSPFFILLTAFFFLSESSLLPRTKPFIPSGLFIVFFRSLINRESEEITQENIFSADMTKEFLNATNLKKHEEQ